MFFIRRTVVEISRNSFRQNFKSYCNAPKHFKEKQSTSAVNETFSNGNNEKNQNENENDKENEKKNEKKNEKDADNEQNSSQNNNFNRMQSDTELMLRGKFGELANKNRESFLSMVHLFVDRDKHRRHHVEFIYAALKHMKEFGVERDIEVYKSILDVMPKGKFIPTNMFQAEFMHYPKNQECAIFLLDQMEYNAVMPDAEIGDLLAVIFGKRSHPMYKYWRMMYWMPKIKHLSPWLLPSPVPDDAFELAKLAVKQMCTVDVESVVEIFNTETIEDSLDKTWIVSGQSPEQQKLLKNHSVDSPLRVEGPFAIWLRNRSINYFKLVGDAEPDENFEPEEDLDDVRDIRMPSFMSFMSPKKSDVVVKKPKRSLHQQDDGTIYAICATGTSTKDSLLSWIRLLEENGNPSLAIIPVLFKFRTSVDDRALVVVNNNSNDSVKK